MLTSGFTSEKESAHELYFAMILFLVRIYVHLLFISCVDHKLPERPLFPCGGVGVFLFLSLTTFMQKTMEGFLSFSQNGCWSFSSFKYV